MTAVEEPACAVARSCSADINKMQKVEGSLEKAHGFKPESTSASLAICCFVPMFSSLRLRVKT